MANRNKLLGLAGAAVGIGAGLAAQRKVLNRRRSLDPERDEALGTRRGERERTLELPDGARIFVEETGPLSSKGVIFVHGSVLRTDLWHYQLAGIGSHRLIFPELRGHGRSQPKGESDYSIRTLAGDLLYLLDELDLEEAIVVGHSVGGMAALQLCHDHPELMGERIKGLVLANTTYGPATETLLGSGVIARIERLTRRPFDAIGKQHERIEKLRRFVRPTDAVYWAVALAAFGPNPSPAHVDLVYDMLAKTPVDVIFDLVRSYRDFDMADHLEDIDLPTLVIGGGHDRLTLAKASYYLAEHLPQADLHVFEDCGHTTMLERHEDFNELLRVFFDETLGAAEKPRRRAAAKP